MTEKNKQTSKHTHTWALHRRELEVFKIQSASKSYFLEEEEPVLEMKRTSQSDYGKVPCSSQYRTSRDS